jgi:hypothetical protein
MMNYYNRIESFITYALSNLKNISKDGVKYPCMRYKNRNFLDSNVVIMHLLQKKWFIEKYLC